MTAQDAGCCVLGQRLVAYGVTPLAGNALAVGAMEGLELIRRDDLNLVYWTRNKTLNLAAEGASFPDARSPETPRHRIFRDRLLIDCVRFVSTFDLAHETALSLCEEVYLLAQIFLDVAAADAATIAIERIDHDGCRLFHTDASRMRLLCTYNGRGTQWLADESVNRLALGSGSNEAICLDPEAVASLPRGAVGLFKGDGWSGRRNSGVVHRSPPAPNGRARRVLLRIDTG